MTQIAYRILRDALGLTEQDRAALAGALIDSLETDPDTGVDEAWLLEIEKRVEELDSGHESTLPLEEVLSDISKRAIGRSRR